MVAGKPRGTGAGRIGARAPLGALRGTFGHFHFGASLKPVRHSVSVIVSRAAHPTRKQRRAPRPRTPRPLHAELPPPDLRRGVPSRRRRGEASRGFHGPVGARHSLPAHFASGAPGRCLHRPVTALGRDENKNGRIPDTLASSLEVRGGKRPVKTRARYKFRF